MDFAFFAINLGYSKSEYEELTPRDVYFLRKAWEDKKVLDTQMIYNAVFTATYNVNRTKHKRALKLWRKRRVQKANMESVNENKTSIREIEENEGKDWVRQIYEANGIKLTERTVENG